MLFTRNHQRLGDLLARTIVVEPTCLYRVFKIRRPEMNASSPTNDLRSPNTIRPPMQRVATNWPVDRLRGHNNRIFSDAGDRAPALYSLALGPCKSYVSSESLTTSRFLDSGYTIP